ncbi:YaeQ protein [Klebsiella pneumoniae]|uniref:YaeQ protein n=1 Tax=Klebsiella pneumoniae TaxID=573 RepID=A0A3S4GR55_KLEPN|nr:YaeQ protein [Klebsiella pneumoniae]
MALKATIYKAAVNVADLDRNQFLDANLTLAQHPSETPGAHDAAPAGMDQICR